MSIQEKSAADRRYESDLEWYATAPPLPTVEQITGPFLRLCQLLSDESDRVSAYTALFDLAPEDERERWYNEARVAVETYRHAAEILATAATGIMAGEHRAGGWRDTLRRFVEAGLNLEELSAPVDWPTIFAEQEKAYE